MSATWIGLRCVAAGPMCGVAGADAPVGDGDDHLLAHAVGGAELEFLPLLVEHVDRAGVGARELHGALHDGGQHLFEVERRVDRLRDLAERLQFADRAGEIVGARAQFVEQAHVLDGDDGLGGEILHQLDLLVGERPDLLAVNDDRADQLVFLQHRHGQQRARAAEFRRWVTRALPRTCPRSERPAWCATMASRGEPGAGSNTPRSLSNSLSAGGTPRWRHRREPGSPSNRNIWPNLASQIRDCVLQHGLENRLQLARRA